MSRKRVSLLSDSKWDTVIVHVFVSERVCIHGCVCVCVCVCANQPALRRDTLRPGLVKVSERKKQSIKIGPFIKEQTY